MNENRIMIVGWRSLERPFGIMLFFCLVLVWYTSFPVQAAEGGITADLPYIIQRWFHVPEGITIRFEATANGDFLGEGILMIRGLQWGQILPQRNAEGALLMVHSLWQDDRVYVWNKQLGVGSIFPSCPQLFLLGRVLALIPYGRDILEGNRSPWLSEVLWCRESFNFDVEVQWQDINMQVIWQYSWPFSHDPDREESLVVVASYGLKHLFPAGKGWSTTAREVLGSEMVESIRWYFEDWEMESYTGWQMDPSAKMHWFEIPSTIAWDVQEFCPDLDGAPVWWEWGVTGWDLFEEEL